MWIVKSDFVHQTAVMLKFVERFAVESLVSDCYDRIHLGNAAGTQCEFEKLTLPVGYNSHNSGSAWSLKQK